MSVIDVDYYYVKGVTELHSYDLLTSTEPSNLQLFLEEAIKSKTGIAKDFTNLVTGAIRQQRIEDFKIVAASTTDDQKNSVTNSDNDLELDLFKEDLMCIVCNGMDVGARNRLLECSDCHSLYHQECHRPVVLQSENDGAWMCQNCKERKKLKKPPTPPITQPSSTKPAPKSTIRSDGHASSSSSRSLSYKSGSGGGSSSKPSSKVFSGKSSTKSSVTPNINIISADKRIQIMKKKAAKLHEKRKHPR